ncbi:helix-turn-helix transcriptional regulator [Paenibacillus sepulcri]|uniref:Helix-turn-helix transcriptional regulator n=1 Tax=Paenibacillus sepulcri TaxID=359917 RepID=A0ABS7C0W5_9BACL|nr:helix-turn-helix transcriptional regulator [Paenibacillus sepulcri]
MTLDILGDPWSLVILCDVLIHNKRHYREFLASDERIATNILSARLQSLTEADLLIKIEGETNRAQTMYRPTQKALDLYPIVFARYEHSDHART